MGTISQFYSENKLMQEMSCVFKDEDTIVDFHTLLEKIRMFTNKSVSDRNIILEDLVFYKGELEAMRVKAEARIRKIEAVAYIQCFEKMKVSGVRWTEELLKAKLAELDLETNDKAYNALLQQFRCCTKWVGILTDSYYILNSTNKILNNNVTTM